MDRDPRLVSVLHEVAALRAAVLADAGPLFAKWSARIVNERFRPSAENLAHYLCLRRRDVTALQRELSTYGLSSMGRSARRVRANLDAILATLEQLTGSRSTVTRPTAEAHREGDERARWRTDRIFGVDPTGPTTRIMVTLGDELAGDVAGCRALIEGGADVARLNAARGDRESWSALLSSWRAAAEQLGRKAPVRIDFAGPRCRTVEVLFGGEGRLCAGDRFALVAEAVGAIDGVHAAATLSLTQLLRELRVGHEVFYDDGKLGGAVVSVDDNRAVIEVRGAHDGGVNLQPDRGFAFPELELDLPVLSSADTEALDFAAESADIIGLSFVQRPQDVVVLQQELVRRLGGRPLPPVVLKIETRLAVRNLPRLIVQAGARQPVAVMIARGELAVELGFERLAEVQGEILELCHAAQVPVVWAAQVLESLVKDGWPSRAEATDASAAQGAECVLLDHGPHQAVAVRMLDGLLRRMDRHRRAGAPLLAALRAWDGPQDMV